MRGSGRTRERTIEPAERTEAGLLVAIFFVLALGYVVGQAAGYALFVKRFGAKELPFAILCMPLVGVVLAWTNLRAVARLGVARTLVLDVAVMVTVSIALRFLVGDEEHAWARFVLPMWDAGVNNANNLVVWGAASRLFDLRQAKRIGPIVSAGRSSALVVGGLLVPAMVDAVGTANLYVVQAIVFGTGLVLLVVLTRLRHAALRGAAEGPDIGRTPPGTDDGTTSRYVRAVFGVVFASMLAYVLVRNIFLDRGAARFPAASDYAAQIGLLNAVQGLLTLFSAIVVSSRFLRRFGLRGGLLALPVVLVVVYVPLTVLDLDVRPQFTLAAAGFVICGAMMFSIRTPAVQLLYQPLDATTRTRAVSTAEGIVEPLALGAAAVVLIVVARAASLGARGMAGAAVVAAIGLAILGRLAFGGYRRALDRALSQRWLRGGGIDLTEPAAVAWLTQRACDADAAHAVSIVGMMEEARVDTTPLLTRLVAHPAATVRTFALTKMLDRPNSLDLDVVERMAVDHDDLDLRAAAARLVARAGRTGATRTLLHDAAPGIRAATLAGLLESEQRRARDMGLEQLEQLGTAEDPHARWVAALALASADTEAPAHLYERLAADPDPAIRAKAHLGAGRHGVALPIERLVDDVCAGATHVSSTDALVSHGDAAIGALVRVVHASPVVDRRTRRALRAICRIDTPAAADALVGLLQHPQGDVRSSAARALRARQHALSDLAVLAVVDRERDDAAGRRTRLTALAGHDGVAQELIRSTLERRDREARRRILDIAALTDAALAVEDIDRALRADDPKLRAYALEALDTSLRPTLRTAVLPLLLDAPASGGVMATAAAASVLHELESGDDSWLGLLAHAALDESARGVALNTPGGIGMIPLIERVVFLREVAPFADLPPETLAEVGRALSEVRLDAGCTLFRKGDDGSSMYIVLEGRVLIHDGPIELDRRGRHELFGELAVLDAEPRTADATALDDALLLRLDQEPLYELMADRPDVLRGFVSNIVRTLRARLADVTALRHELATARGISD